MDVNEKLKEEGQTKIKEFIAELEIIEKRGGILKLDGIQTQKKY